MPYGSDTTLSALLAAKVWAVVGLSTDPTRAAYGVSAFLQAHGVRIVPIHPSAPVVHGEQGYRTLAEVPFPIDVVDLFVRSELAGALVDDAVAVGARGVWMQLGVQDPAGAQRAEAAGLAVVMDHCPKIEWARLGPASPTPASPTPASPTPASPTPGSPAAAGPA